MSQQCIPIPQISVPGVYELTVSLACDGTTCILSDPWLGQPAQAPPPPAPPAREVTWTDYAWLGAALVLVLLFASFLSSRSEIRLPKPSSERKPLKPSDTGEYNDDFADNDQGLK